MKPCYPGVAVVTGAGSGIGRATAKALAARGALVLAADINYATAQETVQQIRDMREEADAYALDVGDVAALEAFAKYVRDTHGVPDVVVNNAGIFVGGPFLDIPLADVQRIVDINLMAVIHGCRLFGRQMVERGHGGHLVNVASLAAFVPGRLTTPYSLAKAGVKHFSECVRAELAPHHIGVTAVCPGLIGTRLAETARVASVTEEQFDLGKQATLKAMALAGMNPDKAAQRIVRGIERNKAVLPIRPEAWLSYRLGRWFPRTSRGAVRVVMGPEVERLGRAVVDRPAVLRAGRRLVPSSPDREKAS